MEVDFVISCGDLPMHYLEYIASSLDVPCYYVRGNHDRYEIGESGAIKTEPQGWVNLDMRRITYRGVSIAGLEGSIRYKPNVPLQYTQSEQWVRAVWLARTMAASRIRTGRGVDLLVAHSPAYGIHDGPDFAHTGFKAFNWLIEQYKPRIFLHGHQHRNYAPLRPTETQSNDTRVINIQPYRILDV
jgi:Icc-related predicted phosphoesterase